MGDKRQNGIWRFISQMKRSGRCLVGDNSKVGSDHPFRDSASICPPVFEVFARRQKNSYGSLQCVAIIRAVVRFEKITKRTDLAVISAN